MKVIHFIAGIDKTEGGTTEYMRLLSTELRKHTDLIVATGISKNPIEIAGVKIKFFNTNILRWFAMLNEFHLFLNSEKPDIVHINGIWSPQNWGFQKKAQALGIKVVVSPHGMLEPWILEHHPLKKKIALFLYQKKITQNASYIHATAQMEANHIQALGFNNPISIIPNGIDLSTIIKLKEQYGTKKMVFLSRIHPKKGIELLLEAWGNCATNGWSLEIAGNGEASYLKNITKRANNLENVRFVGPKYEEEKWKFLRSADVMVLPTHSENFGMVVAEALAIGVPVITTHGAPWEDLETYECGWWINLSVSNLEKAIANATNTSTEVLKTMGSNGRKLVADKYEIKFVTSKVVELYQKVLN